MGTSTKLVSAVAELLEELGAEVSARSVDEAVHHRPDVVVVAAGAPPAISTTLERLTTTAGMGDIPRLGAFRPPALVPEALAAVDDFILLPSHPQELLYRIHRLAGTPAPARQPGLVLDPVRHEVRLDGRPVDLTFLEFRLLEYLVRHRGRVLSRERIYREVWGLPHPGGMRTVDVHVRKLRAKLGEQFACDLQTVRKVGYRYTARDAPRS